ARPGANELAEMWRAAASLERLDAKAKQALAESLLRQVKRTPTPTYAYWALARLGAPLPFYGPLNTVIHPDVAGVWVDDLLSTELTDANERNGRAFALAQIARQTGQRALDLDEGRRETVLKELRVANAAEGWVKQVAEVVESTGADAGR